MVIFLLIVEVDTTWLFFIIYYFALGPIGTLLGDELTQEGLGDKILVAKRQRSSMLHANGNDRARDSKSILVANHAYQRRFITNIFIQIQNGKQTVN